MKTRLALMAGVAMAVVLLGGCIANREALVDKNQPDYDGYKVSYPQQEQYYPQAAQQPSVAMAQDAAYAPTQEADSWDETAYEDQYIRVSEQAVVKLYEYCFGEPAYDSKADEETQLMQLEQWTQRRDAACTVLAYIYRNQEFAEADAFESLPEDYASTPEYVEAPEYNPCPAEISEDTGSVKEEVAAAWGAWQEQRECEFAQDGEPMEYGEFSNTMIQQQAIGRTVNNILSMPAWKPG